MTSVIRHGLCMRAHAGKLISIFLFFILIFFVAFFPCLVWSFVAARRVVAFIFILFDPRITCGAFSFLFLVIFLHSKNKNMQSATREYFNTLYFNTRSHDKIHFILYSVLNFTYIDRGYTKQGIFLPRCLHQTQTHPMNRSQTKYSSNLYARCNLYTAVCTSGRSQLFFFLSRVRHSTAVSWPRRMPTAVCRVGWLVGSVFFFFRFGRVLLFVSIVGAMDGK